MEQLSMDEIETKQGRMKKLLLVGVLFVIVGYGLVVGALYMEKTQLHPQIQNYITEHPDHSLAGGGPSRAGDTDLNQDLIELHTLAPSTLMWMKLGGIAHILAGIFISLFVIVQALMMIPDRLAYLLEEE